MRYCPNCGQELTEEAKFCPKCGFNLEQMSTSKSEKKISDKFAAQFNKMKTDEEMELQLETAEGMNITRAEIKVAAQKKLSGRYGEWFKSIMWIVVAGFAAGLVLFFALNRMISTQLMNSYYDIYRYNHGYSYNSSFSGISQFFWFMIILLAIIGILLISCLGNAVMQWCAIHTLKGRRADGVQIFLYFVKAQKNRVLKANILITIYTFLWSLLFTIPGIIKSASYAMTNYLLEKNSELSAGEAIQLSRKIMHGYKLEFLILRYSFYFWTIVNALSFGLSSFYVLPYQNVTEIQFLEMLYLHHLEEN